MNDYESIQDLIEEDLEEKDNCFLTKIVRKLLNLYIKLYNFRESYYRMLLTREYNEFLYNAKLMMGFLMIIIV